MSGTIVVILLLTVAVLLFIRSRQRSNINVSDFTARVWAALDGRSDIDDYDRLIHTPIPANPLLESARGRLVRVDDKYLRKDGEPISTPARHDIEAILADLARESGDDPSVPTA